MSGSRRSAVLNEVLSLNAQEWNLSTDDATFETILNEVLSLNAQESPGGNMYNLLNYSSMKS